MAFLEFYKPASVAEAVELRAGHPSSVYVAGGTEVNGRGWCVRCAGPAGIDRAVGIAHLPLGGIRRTEAGVVLGSTVTIQEILEHPDAPRVLVDAARQFANRNIRSMATIGGNLGANKSCSNLIPSLLVLDADLEIATPAGVQTLPLADYVAAPVPAALIMSVIVPEARLEAGGATRKHSRTVNDISILSVAASSLGTASRLEQPRVAVGGVAPTVVRLRALEAALDGKPLPSRDAIEAMVRPLVAPIDDVRGSAAYKRQVAAALVGWCLHRAVTTPGGGR